MAPGDGGDGWPRPLICWKNTHARAHANVAPFFGRDRYVYGVCMPGGGGEGRPRWGVAVPCPARCQAAGTVHGWLWGRRARQKQDAAALHALSHSALPPATPCLLGSHWYSCAHPPRHTNKHAPLALYLRAKPGSTRGALDNRACTHATGHSLVHGLQAALAPQHTRTRHRKG